MAKPPIQAQSFGAWLRDLCFCREHPTAFIKGHRNYLGNDERVEQNITVDLVVRGGNALKISVADPTRLLDARAK